MFAFLLEVVAWYATLQVLGVRWYFTGGCSGYRSSLLTGFVSLSFSLVFILGLFVLQAPVCSELVVSDGCFII